jgi:hypothetical protein
MSYRWPSAILYILFTLLSILLLLIIYEFGRVGRWRARSVTSGWTALLRIRSWLNGKLPAPISAMSPERQALTAVLRRVPIGVRSPIGSEKLFR